MKVDVNAKDFFGDTALLKAAQKGVFIDRNPQNDSKFKNFSLKGSERIVRLLLRNGADPNIQNIVRWNSLHCASFSGVFQFNLLILKLRKILHQMCSIRFDKWISFIFRP